MIRVDISRCTGCRSCETACAFFHTGKVSNRLARIKVMHLYETGVDGPVVCIQCREKYCLECPVNAITVGMNGEIVVVPTICNLCGSCERQCPMGAIELHGDLVYVCDLCGGRPKCVDACTEGAIVYAPGTGNKATLADLKQPTEKMNTSEKRRIYVGQLGSLLRSDWRENRG
ncbi:MAG: 4Fe-4S dicluster domain-containing protein [Promethearchaeota archaeon]